MLLVQHLYVTTALTSLPATASLLWGEPQARHAGATSTAQRETTSSKGNVGERINTTESKGS